MRRINSAYKEGIDFWKEYLKDFEKIKELQEELVSTRNDIINLKEIEKKALDEELTKEIQAKLQKMNHFIKARKRNIKDEVEFLNNQIYNMISYKDESDANSKLFWEIDDNKRKLEKIIEKQTEMKQKRSEKVVEKLSEQEKEILNIINQKIQFEEDEIKSPELKEMILNKNEIEKKIEQINQGIDEMTKSLKYIDYSRALRNNEYLGKEEIDTDNGEIDNNLEKIVLAKKEMARNQKIVEIPYVVSKDEFSAIFFDDTKEEANKRKVYDAVIAYVLKAIYANHAQNIKINIVDAMSTGSNYRYLMDLREDTEFVEMTVTSMYNIGNCKKYIMDLLGERNKKLGSRDIETYNKTADVKLEKQVFIINDFIEFFKNEKGLLSNMIEQGKYCGIYYILVDKKIEKQEDEKEQYLINQINQVLKGELKLTISDNMIRICVNNPEYDRSFKKLEHYDEKTIKHLICNLAKYTKEQQRIETERRKVTMDKMLALLPKDLNSIEEYKAPLGMNNKGEIIYLKISNESPHTILLGATGYGKSNLYHEMILNSMKMYSKDEIQFYILDLKAGMGFEQYTKYYASNIKQIVTTSEIDKINVTLKYLCDEIERRSKLFGQSGSGVTEFNDYRKLGKKLPRIILLIDEFQIMFSGAVSTVAKSQANIEKLIAQGRAAGIHVIMCSQNVLGTGITQPMKTQLINRILLRNDAQITESLFSPGKKNNTLSSIVFEVGHLNVGEGFYNNKSGDIDYNQRFITPLVNPELRQKLLTEISMVNEKLGGKMPELVCSVPKTFEDLQNIYLNSNKYFSKMINPTIILGEQDEIGNNQFYKTFTSNQNESFYVAIKDKFKRENFIKAIITCLKLWKNKDKLKLTVLDFSGFNKSLLPQEMNINYVEVREKTENKVELVKNAMDNLLKENEEKYNFVFVYGYNTYEPIWNRYQKDEGICELIDTLYLNGYKKNIHSFAFMDYSFALITEKTKYMFEESHNYVFDEAKTGILEFPKGCTISSDSNYVCYLSDQKEYKKLNLYRNKTE